MTKARATSKSISLDHLLGNLERLQRDFANLRNEGLEPPATSERLEQLATYMAEDLAALRKVLGSPKDSG